MTNTLRLLLGTSAVATLATLGCSDVTAPTTEVAQLVMMTSTTTLPSIGRTASFQVVALDASGSSLPLPAIVWSSNDAETVSVDQSGTVTALKDGDAIVSASYKGLTASTAVQVRAAIEMKVWISGMTNASLDVANDGSTARVTVTASAP